MQVQPESLTNLGTPISFDSIVEAVVTAGTAIGVLAFVTIVSFVILHKFNSRLLHSVGAYDALGKARNRLHNTIHASDNYNSFKSEFIEAYGERAFKRVGGFKERDQILSMFKSGDYADSADAFDAHEERWSSIMDEDRERRRKRRANNNALRSRSRGV